MKDQILTFLKAEALCVIATASPEGKPESAIVGFSENEHLEIIVGTSNQSRKHRNMVHNPHVSLVFGPSKDYQEVQYEGVARELSGDELAERKQQHFVKQPVAMKYEDDPNQTYWLITPTWARLVQSGPTFIGEITDFS